MKQAFGKTTGQEHTGRNLRVDLLHAVDDVTSAMAVLVDELSKGMYDSVIIMITTEICLYSFHSSI